MHLNNRRVIGKRDGESIVSEQMMWQTSSRYSSGRRLANRICHKLDPSEKENLVLYHPRRGLSLIFMKEYIHTYVCVYIYMKEYNTELWISLD